MIAILNFTGTPITQTQRLQIVASIVEQSDKRFIVEYPQSRVYEVTPRATAQETVDAVPLTPAQWRQYAVIPFSFDSEVIRLVNARRGYDWPVVRAIS